MEQPGLMTATPDDVVCSICRLIETASIAKCNLQVTLLKQTKTVVDPMRHLHGDLHGQNGVCAGRAGQTRETHTRPLSYKGVCVCLSVGKKEVVMVASPCGCRFLTQTQIGKCHQLVTF